MSLSGKPLKSSGLRTLLLAGVRRAFPLIISNL